MKRVYGYLLFSGRPFCSCSHLTIYSYHYYYCYYYNYNYYYYHHYVSTPLYSRVSLLTSISPRVLSSPFLVRFDVRESLFFFM